MTPRGTALVSPSPTSGAAKPPKANRATPRNDAFRTRWAAHDARLHHTGTKRFRHPLAGDLTVAFNAMELPADPGLTLTVYTAQPGSPTEEKLSLLASWTATQAPPSAAAGKT